MRLALGPETGFHEGMPEMPGILVNHLPIAQADIAPPVESGHRRHRAVLIPLTGKRANRCREANFVALRERNRLGVIELEFPGFAQGEGCRIGHRQPIALGEAACRLLHVLEELDHLARPVGFRLAPLGFPWHPPPPGG